MLRGSAPLPPQSADRQSADSSARSKPQWPPAYGLPLRAHAFWSWPLAGSKRAFGPPNQWTQRRHTGFRVGFGSSVFLDSLLAYECVGFLSMILYRVALAP